jgi:large subunit ribosomal protein L32e
MDKEKLNLRRKVKKKKPVFKRQEQFKHRKLGEKWRRPRGKQSKLRRGEKARGKKPGMGFSSPKAVRGLDKSGLREVRVFSPKDVDKLNHKEEIGVIGSSVGKKKRADILKKAEEKKVRITNI